MCADARHVVDSVVDGMDVEVTEVDIDSDADYKAKYDWDVPVVLLNGRQHSFHRVDPGRLRHAIQRVQQASG